MTLKVEPFTPGQKGLSIDDPIIGHGGFKAKLVSDEGFLASSTAQFRLRLNEAPDYTSPASFGLESITPSYVLLSAWSSAPVEQTARLECSARVYRNGALGNREQAEPMNISLRTDPDMPFNVRLLPVADTRTIAVTREELSVLASEGRLFLIKYGSHPGAEHWKPPGQRIDGNMFTGPVPLSWFEPSAPMVEEPWDICLHPDFSGIFDVPGGWQKFTKRRMVSFVRQEPSEEYVGWISHLEHRVRAFLSKGPVPGEPPSVGPSLEDQLEWAQRRIEELELLLQKLA